MTVKNLFTNPDDGSSYTWHINHGWDGDSSTGVDNALTWSATTGGTAIPQAGETQPQLWTLSGSILHRAQHEAFLVWAALSQEHSIYFRDFDNVEYEVVIQKYSWQRVGCSRNLSDSTMPYNIFRYQLELLVLAVIEEPP